MCMLAKEDRDGQDISNINHMITAVLGINVAAVQGNCARKLNEHKVQQWVPIPSVVQES